MEIKLLLSKKEILQRVKSKTHFKGVADLAANAANTKEAVRYTYNEQAGDDPNSDFLLLGSLRNGVNKFKTLVTDYITTFNEGDVTAGNIHDTLDDTTDDVFTINFIVSERFNKALTQPLADLASSYIEDHMIYEWYLPINADVATNYAVAAGNLEADVQRCFIKRRPDIPEYKWPTSISVTAPSGSSVSIPIGQIQEISYVASYEQNVRQPVDDVVAVVTSPDDPIVTPCKCIIHRGHWAIEAVMPGTATVRLYSKHNDTVYDDITVMVV